MIGRADAAINLAAVPDFSLGALRVQPSARRVAAGGREQPVEPRVMQALVALAEADGAVVSREALTDRCWGGRIVGEDAINRCIAKVRRLAETADPPAYAIETIAKVGYRLRPCLPPTGCGSLPIDEPAAVAAAVPPSPPPVPWRWVVAAVALLLAAGLAIALRDLRAPVWTVESSRPLPPDLGLQYRPRISPDGTRLVYTDYHRHGRNRIYVVDLGSGAKTLASLPDDDADEPAWASDGSHLAYMVPGEHGGPCRIMVTAFPAGTPKLAGRCQRDNTTSLAWQPGQRALFLVDQNPILDGQTSGLFDAIFRLDLATGALEQVTVPLASESDETPRVSPDGQWLAYIRRDGDQNSVLRLRRLRGGEERQIDCDNDVLSADWTSDSSTLIASTFSLPTHQLLACPIDGTPFRQIYTNAEGLYEVATGPHDMLAVQVARGQDNLARASSVPRAAPDIVDPAPGMTVWPAFAPDGTLAFSSNRSGHYALWTRQPGGLPVELPIPGLTYVARPVWSPDSSRIAFVDLRKNIITMHVVTARGEPVAAFEVPSMGYGMPNWTPDGRYLITFDKRILMPVRIDVRNPASRQPILDQPWDGVTFHDGAMYGQSGLKPGIWQLDGTPRLITSDYPAARQPRLAFLGNELLLPDLLANGDTRILAQPLTGGPSHPAFIAPSAEPITPFAVDPRSGEVLYVCNVSSESHIDLFNLSRR